MKVLKFKIWDKIAETMHEPFDLKDLMSNEDLRPMAEHYEYLQFTGLMDKNSVEIYEGDVVKFQPIAKVSEIYQVEYRHNSFVYTHPDKEGQTYTARDYTEVIGNIYENPELLGNK